MQKMPSRTALLLSALLASTGHAQTLVFTADNEEFIADLSTAPSLAVGGTIAIVVGSHGMHLINKASPFSVLFTETYAANPPVPVRATDYPFVTVEPLDPFGLVNGHLVFPSAAYDPYTGRLWMASSDSRSLITQGLSPEVARACTPFLPGRSEGLGHQPAERLLYESVVVLHGAFRRRTGGSWRARVQLRHGAYSYP